ncbi:MAG: OsmC family protein [Candidatus Binatia bacterium]
MSEQAHHYETTVEWTADREGQLHTPNRPPIRIGAPPEFGGPSDAWSPEQLCVAAVNACVMATFLAIAGNSKLVFSHYSASATGMLEKVEGRGPVITRVVVKPRVTVGADVDRSRVERILKMAEKNCYISNSLQAEVALEPQVVVE